MSGHHHHHHGHGHHHHHHHAANSSTKMLLIATGIIFLFALIEALGGWFANSLALWSDAGHMAADAAALILAAIAAWLSNKPPSDKHSFGLARAEILGATFSSMLLLLIVIAIVIEAIERLHHPSPVSGGTVIVIAAVGFIANVVVAWVLSRGEKNLNVKAAILHVLGDLLGSVAAIIVGIVIYFTHWYPIDPILSFVISALIFIASFRLLLETFSILMESVPKGMKLNEIGQRMAAIEDVCSVHDLHVWTLGTEKIMLTAHLTVQDLQHWEKCFNSTKTMLKKEYHIEHITLQPEIKAKSLYQLQEPK